MPANDDLALLEQALGEAEKALTDRLNDLRTKEYPVPAAAKFVAEGHLITIAAVVKDVTGLHVDQMRYRAAFTRHMTAMETRRQEHMRALADAAERRAEESVAREKDCRASRSRGGHSRRAT